MSLVDNIDGHYKQQLQTHEDDYKKAYKQQMLKVRKELEFLKEKQNEATGALMNDDRITSLRMWIHWFKIKSMELDVQLNKQKQTHIRQSEDQKNKDESEAFLKGALLESMKQNKLLNAACNRQQKQNDKLKAFLKNNNVGLPRSNATITNTETASIAVASAQHFTKQFGGGETETVSKDQTVKDGDASMTDKEQMLLMDQDIEQDEMIAIDNDGGGQVDIKIPKTFMTQGNKLGGREMDNDDLIFMDASSQRLPQTKDEYREFKKMARFATRSANQDLVLPASDSGEPSIAN